MGMGCAWKRAIAQALKACRPESVLKVMDRGLVLKLSGSAFVMDMATDAMQPGQVYQCEREHPSMRTFYENSWEHEPYVAAVVKRTGLSGAFCAMLLAIIIVQWGYGWWRCWHAKRFLGEVERSTADSLNTKMRELTRLLSDLAVVSELAGAMHSSKLFREISGNIDDIFLQRLPQYDFLEVRQFGAQKFQVLLGSIFRVVLVENTSTMILSTAFLCLRIDDMTALGIAKVIFSLGLAFGGALSKAAEVLKYTVTVGHRFIGKDRFLVLPTFMLNCLAAYLVGTFYYSLLHLHIVKVFAVLACFALSLVVTCVCCTPSSEHAVSINKASLMNICPCGPPVILSFQATSVGLLILGMLAIVAAKLYFAFQCESHFFSLVSMSCIARIP